METNCISGMYVYLHCSRTTWYQSMNNRPPLNLSLLYLSRADSLCSTTLPPPPLPPPSFSSSPFPSPFSFLYFFTRFVAVSNHKTKQIRSPCRADLHHLSHIRVAVVVFLWRIHIITGRYT